jgi:hypothetical protein
MLKGKDKRNNINQIEILFLLETLILIFNMIFYFFQGIILLYFFN